MDNEFTRYMELKRAADKYMDATNPFKERIQRLETIKKMEMLAIERKYNTLIEQEKSAMSQACGQKEFECKHDIPVILDIVRPNDIPIQTCTCLTCGERLIPERLSTAYIYFKSVIDASEATPILSAMRNRINELYSENPNMSMIDVKYDLAMFIEGLSKEQRRS